LAIIPVQVQVNSVQWVGSAAGCSTIIFPL